MFHVWPRFKNNLRGLTAGLPLFPLKFWPQNKWPKNLPETKQQNLCTWKMDVEMLGRWNVDEMSFWGKFGLFSGAFSGCSFQGKGHWGRVFHNPLDFLGRNVGPLGFSQIWCFFFEGSGWSREQRCRGAWEQDVFVPWSFSIHLLGGWWSCIFMGCKSELPERSKNYNLWWWWWWFARFFYFFCLYLGKIPNLTSIFFKGVGSTTNQSSLGGGGTAYGMDQTTGWKADQSSWQIVGFFVHKNPNSPLHFGGFGVVLNVTPRKINMEPKNHPIEKENHLPNHHFQVPC